jgi:hypothetical protein
MFESKNVKAIGEIAIVDSVWEARYQIAAYALFDDSPPFRSFKNDLHCSVRFIKELNAQGWETAFVISSGLN